MKNSTDSQSNMYQLTFNNPIEKGYTHEKISDTLRSYFKTLQYHCMADEQGSTFHTHCFAFFNSRVRFSMIQKYFPGVHIEKCRGSVSDNIAYVKKTGKWELDEHKQETKIEGTFEEHGIQPPDSRGRRYDLTELYHMIKSGMTNTEIIEVNQDYILQLDKLDKIRTMILYDLYECTVRQDLEVVYISGVTGAGKTRSLFETYGKDLYRITDYKNPWDSYKGQPVVAFEEFRDSISLKNMLAYCDIYPIELPCRYANKYACFSKIAIVSNWPLERQYENEQRTDVESWKAFLRRISKVVIFEGEGRITEYSSVDEYLNRFHKINDENTLPKEFREPEQMMLSI